jgi:hypothetical protein
VLGEVLRADLRPGEALIKLGDPVPRVRRKPRFELGSHGSERAVAHRSHGIDQHQRGYAVRGGNGGAQGEMTAPGMTEEDAAFDAGVVQDR